MQAKIAEHFTIAGSDIYTACKHEMDEWHNPFRHAGRAGLTEADRLNGITDEFVVYATSAAFRAFVGLDDPAPEDQ